MTTEIFGYDQAKMLLDKGKLMHRALWLPGVFIAKAYPEYEDGRVSSVIEFNRSFQGVGACLDNFIVMRTSEDTLAPYTMTVHDILQHDWEEVAFPVMETQKEALIKASRVAYECRWKNKKKVVEEEMTDEEYV